MLLNEGDSFIDIGANIGIFSSILSRYQNLNQSFKVYAFEANPETYERLLKNAKNYGFEAFNVAISDKNGTLNFLDGAVSHVFTTVEHFSDYNIDSNPIQIECKRLEDCEIFGNRLILKIDVEGQELEVLRGAEAFFKADYVKVVYLDGYSNSEALDFLQFYNFELLNGRTLTKIESNTLTFSILAIKK